MEDVLALEGPVLLGSRLKRLAEQLQAGAQHIALDCGLNVQPSQMALIAAIARHDMLTVGEASAIIGISQPAVTRIVGQLIDARLIVATPLPDDKRSKSLSLTPAGQAIIDTARTAMWPRTRAAVEELTDIKAFLAQIAEIETALAQRPLHLRPKGGLAIRPYSDELAPYFDRINREWISDMYVLEQIDIDRIENPREHIIDTGGDILFVEDPELGIIGTCGLLKVGPRAFELTKMGVSKSARGKNAGRFLLTATIERAFAMGCDTLFLLTNKKSEAAIHLYEQLGFVHDAGIMEQYGAEYERCNVAMLYKGPFAKAA